MNKISFSNWCHKKFKFPPKKLCDVAWAVVLTMWKLWALTEMFTKVNKINTKEIWIWTRSNFPLACFRGGNQTNSFYSRLLRSSRKTTKTYRAKTCLEISIKSFETFTPTFDPFWLRFSSWRNIFTSLCAVNWAKTRKSFSLQAACVCFWDFWVGWNVAWEGKLLKFLTRKSKYTFEYSENENWKDPRRGRLEN